MEKKIYITIILFTQIIRILIIREIAIKILKCGYILYKRCYCKSYSLLFFRLLLIKRFDNSILYFKVIFRGTETILIVLLNCLYFCCECISA